MCKYRTKNQIDGKHNKNKELNSDKLKFINNQSGSMSTEQTKNYML